MLPAGGELKPLEGYRLYTAMYEFTARSDDELSLSPGDMVWVCAVDLAYVYNVNVPAGKAST